jgi:hypothetical protein
VSCSTVAIIALALSRGPGFEKKGTHLLTDRIEELSGAHVSASSRERRDASWWIIIRYQRGQMKVLTAPWVGKEVLPVFSHEEEAESFLRLADPADGWRVRASDCGDLVSVLYGPCAGSKGVALDPLPEMLGDPTIALVVVERNRFYSHFLRHSSISNPPQVPR